MFCAGTGVFRTWPWRETRRDSGRGRYRLVDQPSTLVQTFAPRSRLISSRMLRQELHLDLRIHGKMLIKHEDAPRVGIHTCVLKRTMPRTGNECEPIVPAPPTRCATLSRERSITPASLCPPPRPLPIRDPLIQGIPKAGSADPPATRAPAGAASTKPVCQTQRTRGPFREARLHAHSLIRAAACRRRRPRQCYSCAQCQCSLPYPCACSKGTTWRLP